MTIFGKFFGCVTDNNYNIYFASYDILVNNNHNNNIYVFPTSERSNYNMPTLIDILIGVATLFLLIYLYTTRVIYTYFSRNGIPDLSPTFPLGNSQQLFKGSNTVSLIFSEIYERFKAKGVKYGGYYMLFNKNLMILDPELIKRVLVKDFSHFSNRGTYCNEKDDPISAHMFNLEGEKWKEIRNKLSPTFTSGKMKYMFETVVKCTEPIEQHLDAFSERNEPLDVKNVFSNYTIDVIGSCAFGIDCNSFKDKDSQFVKYGFKAIQNVNMIKAFLLLSLPELGRRLHITLTPEGVQDFFYSIIGKTVEFRKTTGTSRKDFMQLLVELHESGKINFDELVSEAFLFFLAGFETSSTTGMFCLFELSQNEEVQGKLRDEVRDVLARYDGKITYEAIHEMKYLAQVVDGKWKG